MKRVCLLIALTAATGIMFAQCPIAKGQSQFNAGVGLSSWGIPLYIGLDHGVHKDITLGGELSYNTYREEYKHHDYNQSVIGITGNANYHFNHVLSIPRNWDFYAGLNLGVNIWNTPDEYDGPHSTGLGLGVQIGGRYYFTDTVGVNLEFGSGAAFSNGRLGISAKL
jgi:outer membrane immunogenic protein